MPKLKTIPDSEVLSLLSLIPEQAHEGGGHYKYEKSDHNYGLTDEEAFILTALRAGDLSHLAELFLSEEPITRIVRDAVAYMIQNEVPFNDYLMVAVKNKDFEKNTSPERQKFVRMIGRMRVGFAIEVFGGFERNMHEAAIQEACDLFGISRSASEKLWREYRELDVPMRNRFRGIWGLMCKDYDGITLTYFLRPKK